MLGDKKKMSKADELKAKNENLFEHNTILLNENERLKNENEQLKNRNAELKGMYAHSAREAGTYKQFFEQLKKENAELDCQKNRNKSCYSCVNATERCFRNEICCPCQKYKSYKKENAELKAKNKWYSEQVCNNVIITIKNIGSLVRGSKMTKEDKQIIDRAVKEYWRLGDRSHLKRLLKKNLKLYRENVELERKLEQTERDITDLKEKYNRVDIIGYDALKSLTEAKERIRTLLFHITNDTFYVTFETREQSVEKARQFLKGLGKVK